MNPTYNQQLSEQRWKDKRLEILERDNNRCQRCKSKFKTLHVHHLAYIAGARPWEHPNEFLITLCEDCHKAEETYKIQIKSLIRELSIDGYLFEEIFNHLQTIRNG